MSLQVCHCGWSSVTTHHGLRTHQGMMGCTPKGVKVEEREQLYSRVNVGFKMDIMVEVSVKTDVSLQVCHCGWSNMTTYHGLRTHQGMMGCTPKGMRIPESEQHIWKNHYKEVAQGKYQPRKRTIVKKEEVPSPPSRQRLLPSTNVRTNSAAATVKEEYKPHVATSQHSLQTATESHRQLQDFSTGVQARRHPTPTHPETVVRPKVKDRKDQRLPQMADIGVMAGNRSSRTKPATTATIKEEPESPIPRRPSQRTSNQKSGREPQEQSAGVQVKQVNSLVREYPIIPPQVTVDQLKKKDQENHTVSQPDVKACDTKERTESEVQQKIQLREEKMSEIKEWTKRTCESVPDSTSTNTRANSAAAKTKKKDDPKPLHEAARPDFSTGMKVKSLNMECPTTYPPTEVRPKEKHREEQTLLQVLPSINSEKVVRIKEEPRSPFATPQHSLRRATNSKASRQLQEFCTGVQMNRSSDTGPTTPPRATVQPKEKDSKDQISQNLPDSTSSTTQMDPASAEATTEDDPHSSCDTAQVSDCSTGLKVKELAQMISAMTTQERTARPKEKEKEVRKLSQAELITQKLSATGQETAVHPKEKDKENQNLSQNLPDSSNATTQMDPASAEATPEDDPKSSCDTAQVSDCSTGLKVKEMAQMFSTNTTQETTVRPKGQQRGERKLSQNLPDSTSSTTQMNAASAEDTTEDDPKPSCDTAPDFSAGLKVKELAQMFSAITTQDTTVRPKGKNREEPRQSQARLIAQKLSATTGQESAVLPKKKVKENQNLSQKVPTSATTQTNSASAKAPTEENPKPSGENATDFSAGLKVKDLARMFSATTTQETVRPKGRNRKGRKSQWM